MTRQIVTTSISFDSTVGEYRVTAYDERGDWIEDVTYFTASVKDAATKAAEMIARKTCDFCSERQLTEGKTARINLHGDPLPICEHCLKDSSVMFFGASDCSDEYTATSYEGIDIGHNKQGFWLDGSFLTKQQLGELGWLLVHLAGKIDNDSVIKMISDLGDGDVSPLDVLSTQSIEMQESIRRYES